MSSDNTSQEQPNTQQESAPHIEGSEHDKPSPSAKSIPQAGSATTAEHTEDIPQHVTESYKLWEIPELAALSWDVHEDKSRIQSELLERAKQKMEELGYKSQFQSERYLALDFPAGIEFQLNLPEGKRGCAVIIKMHDPPFHPSLVFGSAIYKGKYFVVHCFIDHFHHDRPGMLLLRIPSAQVGQISNAPAQPGSRDSRADRREPAAQTLEDYVGDGNVVDEPAPKVGLCGTNPHEEDQLQAPQFKIELLSKVHNPTVLRPPTLTIEALFKTSLTTEQLQQYWNKQMQKVPRRSNTLEVHDIEEQVVHFPRNRKARSRTTEPVTDDEDVEPPKRSKRTKRASSVPPRTRYAELEPSTSFTPLQSPSLPQERVGAIETKTTWSEPPKVDHTVAMLGLESARNQAAIWANADHAAIMQAILANQRAAQR